MASNTPRLGSIVGRKTAVHNLYGAWTVRWGVFSALRASWSVSTAALVAVLTAVVIAVAPAVMPVEIEELWQAIIWGGYFGSRKGVGSDCHFLCVSAITLEARKYS